MWYHDHDYRDTRRHMRYASGGGWWATDEVSHPVLRKAGVPVEISGGRIKGQAAGRWAAGMPSYCKPCPLVGPSMREIRGG